MTELKVRSLLEEFYWNGECEDLREYKPGGYYPLYLGDILHSRYHILNKLGYGSFGTVWLAEDKTMNK